MRRGSIMTRLVSRKKEGEALPRYVYRGQEFFKLFAGMGWPHGKERGAIVVIGETFEQVPEMGRFTLAVLHEDARVSVENLSSEALKEFMESYCLREIYGDPRESSVVTMPPFSTKIEKVDHCIDFIESYLSREILWLGQDAALPKYLKRLKPRIKGERTSSYPLLNAWGYALLAAEVYQTPTIGQEPSPPRQTISLHDYDEFR